MKKTFFSFAIAAVVAAAMASCGSKTANNGENQDSAAVENAAEAAPQAEVKIEDQKELTCDAYTLTVPDGWKATSRMVNSSCNMKLKQPPFTTAAPNTMSAMTPENFAAEREKENYTKLDDVTANGHTFSVFYKEGANDQQFIMSCTGRGDGLVTVKFMTGAHKLDKAEAKKILIENVKTVLEKLTIK